MTAICGGGTSSPKPGIAPTIFISSSAAGALLNNVPTLWAVPLAAYIGALTYNASTFCSTDPPADPGITATDIVNLVAGPLNAGFGSAAQKVAQLVSRYAWYQFCECDTVATPAPPSPPSEPAGAPDINPVYLPAPTVGACASYENTVDGTYGSPNSTFGVIGSGARSTSAGSVPIPIGTTSVRLHWGMSFVPSGSSSALWISGYNVNGSLILSQQRTLVSAGGDFVDTFTVPTGVVSIKSVEDLGSGSGQAVSVHVLAEFYCGGQTPSMPATPCCPPDPLITAKLQQIMDLVTLIQRQGVPFGSIPGDVHSGLSGNNHFAVSTPMLGVQVDVTTLPASLGIESGDPQRHFDVGYVSLGNEDEWFGTRRVTNLGNIWQPRWAGMVTRVGYSFHPGVVATITELVREP